ncbi:MAG: Rnase Y domain-containing protein, partial [Candidatus Omnitrophica bacterium]|nr:Rnase Y domain-containing protein [Candidatus Omnitrophota bacterium]
MWGLFIYLGISLFSLGLGYLLRKHIAEKKIKTAEAQAQQILEQAHKLASEKRREVELEAKDFMYRLRQDFERETKERREELSNLEKRIAQKEENLERRLNLLEAKEKEIEERSNYLKKQEDLLKQKEQHLHSLILEEKDRLQKISSLTIEEARQILLNRINEELTHEKAILIKRQEEETREIAERKAKEIISLAIQKCA